MHRKPDARNRKIRAPAVPTAGPVQARPRASPRMILSLLSWSRIKRSIATQSRCGMSDRVLRSFSDEPSPQPRNADRLQHSTLHSLLFSRDLQRCPSLRHLRAKQYASSQPVHREDGPPDHGNGLALKTGGDAMWYLPLSITLEMKKTRSSWSLILRVQFTI